MPTYEYECAACHQVFEKFQSFSDPPVKTCPHCKSKKVSRLIGGAAIVFKGSGFYINDSKGGAKAAGATAAASDSSSGSSSSAAPSTGSGSSAD